MGHLIKFKESIGYSGNITKKITKNKYISYRLTFNSKRISKRLADLNCVQAKSLIYSPPKLENPELERHMIRGIFDADGSLTMSEIKNKKTGCFQFYAQLVGTVDTLDFVRNHVNIHCPDVSFNKKYNKKGKTFSLRITGVENTILFCNYLYGNSSFFLDRKHKIFIQALNAPYVRNNVRVGSNIGEGCDANTEITKQLKIV